jgi:hypothetical protein
MNLARIKFGERSISSTSNLLTCGTRRHNKDLACSLADRREPVKIVTQPSVYTVEPYQIRNMIFRGRNENSNNCSFALDYYNPGVEFKFLNLESPAEEQKLSNLSSLTTCKLTTWDCRPPKLPARWEQHIVRCDKDNEVVINYEQDEEQKFVELRPVLYSYTPSGFASANSQGLIKIPMQPQPGFGAVCKGVECVWSNLPVPRKIHYFRPHES